MFPYMSLLAVLCFVSEKNAENFEIILTETGLLNVVPVQRQVLTK